MMDEVYYLRKYNPKTGKPLLPIPYRWHLCDHCTCRALVEHGSRSGKPKQGKCVFCGERRVSER
jgi:hypothetical protein